MNEFPEWFTVDENRVYRIAAAGSGMPARVYLGSELIAGVDLPPGDWIVEPASD